MKTYIVDYQTRQGKNQTRHVEAADEIEAAATVKGLFSRSYVTIKDVRPLDAPVDEPAPKAPAKTNGKPVKVEPKPMSLSDRAMLSSLVINAWEARRTDKKISDEVAKAHKTNVNVGAYNKTLLPDCESHAQIFRVIGQARSFFKLSSLPWLQDGTRILLAEGYQAFADGYRTYKEAFDKAVNDFLAEYDTHVAAAKVALNGMFNEAEYPTKEQIRRKFRMRLVICPMPSAGDFRVGLSDAAAEAVRAQITEDVTDAIALAQDEAWNRFREALAEFGTKLANTDAVYRDSLFNNLGDLVALLPSLNIRQDATFTSLVTQVSSLLSSTTPDTCRKDKAVRAETAKQVEKLLKLMPAPTN